MFPGVSPVFICVPRLNYISSTKIDTILLFKIIYLRIYILACVKNMPMLFRWVLLPLYSQVQLCFHTILYIVMGVYAFI